jgi:tetratricopeptide (TPR) repeat protein
VSGKRSALLLALAIAAGFAIPAHAQDLLVQAQAAAERGAMDSAYTILVRAVDREPGRAEAHFWLGQVAGTRAAEHRTIHSFFLARRAKKAFGRAVQLEPENPAYLEGLGRFLALAPGIVGGDRDSARVLGQHLLRIDRMRGTFFLAQFLGRATPADHLRAEALIEQFAARPSGGREGEVRLGLYFARGRPERAIPIGERLVAEDSTDALGHLVLGSALVALRRDPAAAVRHLRWAIQHPPPITTDGREYWAPLVWYVFAQAHSQAGETDSARAAFQETLRLEPGFRRARTAMDSLLRGQ